MYILNAYVLNFLRHFQKLLTVFKCTRCKYEDPVPSWLLEECGGFTPLKKIPKKDFKMTCPRCGRDTMEYKNDNV